RIRSKHRGRRPPKRNPWSLCFPSQTSVRAVERNHKGARRLVAYQHDHAIVDDWRTCHSVKVLKGTERIGPTHCAIVAVRDQSKFSEEGHHSILVGCRSWRCRIVCFECDLLALTPDFTSP